MIGIKFVLKQITRNELALGAILVLFWPVLHFYPQPAVIIYPFIIGLIFICYYLQKFKEENAKILLRSDQANRINHAYISINDVAHELRSPLAGLKMACEQLSQDPGNQDLVKAMVATFPKQVDKLFLLTTEISKAKSRIERESSRD